jgi:staphylococcal nuclease domain-containing protein 1
VDVKKELLSKGYFKLAQNAYTLIANGQRYTDLKDAQSSAELKNIGIWKDAVPKK